MKLKDVTVGSEYMTKVGDTLVKVKVTSSAGRAYSFGPSHDGPTRFHCSRVDNGQALPKPRTAAALHPVPDESANTPAGRAGRRLAAEHAKAGVTCGDDALRNIIRNRHPLASDTTIAAVVRGYRTAPGAT